MIKLTATKTVNLIPLGKITFRFGEGFGQNDRINVCDVEILYDTNLDLTADQVIAIKKVMRRAKTDLLTDGHKFYTTRGDVLTEIKHPRFTEVFNSEFAGVVPAMKLKSITI